MTLKDKEIFKITISKKMFDIYLMNPKLELELPVKKHKPSIISKYFHKLFS